MVQWFCLISWMNAGSVWHKDQLHRIYLGHWPIFYGPLILSYIFKTIWWRNIILGIMPMDQCDAKIDLIKYRSVYIGQWPIFCGPVILLIISWRLFILPANYVCEGYTVFMLSVCDILVLQYHEKAMMEYHKILQIHWYPQDEHLL